MLLLGQAQIENQSSGGISTKHVNCFKTEKTIVFIVTFISRTHFIHQLMKIKFTINKPLDFIFDYYIKNLDT